MKILALHSDFIEFEAKKKAIKDPEPLKNKKEKIDESLVVFMSVEKKDEANPQNTAKTCISNIKDIASQVKEKNIVLYPYVHLTNDPSNPKTALQVLDIVEKDLKKNYKIHRSPFGWYKSFNISVKGHPLSELSREFGPEASGQSPDGLESSLSKKPKEEKKPEDKKPKEEKKEATKEQAKEK